jgi:AcrR family transcriptional regulator
MLAVVDEVGYEGVRVGKVAERAGVSRSTLYEYFGDRHECFLATFEALLSEGIATIRKAYAGSGPPEQRLRHALDTLVEAVIAQPAAARLCFLEAYGAGTSAAKLRDRATDTLEDLVLETMVQSPARAEMPREIVSAIVGGMRIVIQTRLWRRTEPELREIAPTLWQWMLDYEAPMPTLPRVALEQALGPRFVPATHEQRLFVALTKTIHDKGYAETILADVVAAASMSLSTFYTTFDSKESAFIAAFDYGVEQAFSAARQAYEQESDWPLQVHAAARELLAFLAGEPEWAYLAIVEILAAGPRAREHRDRTLGLFTSLLMMGYDGDRPVDPVAVEATGGAAYALIHHHICHRGADRLPEILPAAVFVLLAPFVGNAEAAAVASGAVADGAAPPLTASPNPK